MIIKRIFFLVLASNLAIPNIMFAMEANHHDNHNDNKANNNHNNDPLNVCYTCFEPEVETQNDDGTVTTTPARDRSNTPKIMLSCKHTFCTECLNRTIVDAINNKTIPECCHQDHIKIDKVKRAKLIASKKPFKPSDYQTKTDADLTLDDIKRITNDDIAVQKIKDIKKQKKDISLQQKDTNNNLNNKDEIEPENCCICKDHHPVNELVIAPCTHTFGNKCIIDHFSAAMAQSKAPFCPHPYCMELKEANLIELKEIRRFIKDQDAIDLVDAFFFKQDYRKNPIPGTKNCPSSACSAIYYVDAHQVGPMVCQNPKCKQKYCMQCQINHTVNLTCQQALAIQNGKMEELNKLNEDVIANETFPCPNPKPLENGQRCPGKIIGKTNCNKVQCAVKECGYKFCWICLEEAEEVAYQYIHKKTRVPLDTWGNGRNACITNNPLLDPTKKKALAANPQPALPNPAAHVQPANPPAIQPALQQPANNPAPLFWWQQPAYQINHNGNNDDWIPLHDPINARNHDQLQRDYQRLNNGQNRDPLGQNQQGRIGNGNNPRGNNGRGPKGNGPNGNGPDGSHNKNKPFNFLKNIKNFNPMYLLLAVPPALAALRIVQWVKYPQAAKLAIIKLTNLIEIAESQDPSNVTAQLNKDEHLLTITNEQIAHLRELALRDQYKEFAEYAASCKKQLQEMTASNAGILNGFKKIRWGLSADFCAAKHAWLNKLGRA